ncbi:MAG: histidine kinase [Anaerolineae bacterium]
MRTRILAWSFIPTMIILGAVALFTFQTYWRVTERLVMERNREMTRFLAQQLGVEMTRYADILHAVANHPDIQSPAPGYRQTALRWLVTQLDDFDGGVVVLDAGGHVVAADPRCHHLLGEDWSDRSSFLQQKHGQMLVFGTDIEDDGPDGVPVLPFAMPIRGPGLEFRGVVVGMIRLGAEQPNAVYRSLYRHYVRQSSRMMLVDGRGRAIEYRYQLGATQEMGHLPAVQAVTAGHIGALRTRDLDGREVIASYSPVDNTTWGLVVEESWAELSALSVGYGRLLLVLLILGLTVPAAFTALGIRRITGPIATLTSAAERMAAGDLRQEIAPPEDVELQKLALAFNRMSVQLQSLYAGLEQRVADRTRELATLGAIADLSSRSPDLDETVSAALDETLRAMGMDAGVVYCPARDGKTLQRVAYRGMSDGSEDRGELHMLMASRSTPESPQVWHADEGDAPPWGVDAEWQTAVRVSLWARGEVLGIMLLGARRRRDLAPEECSLLEAIGHQVGVVVENARLYERAEESAVEAERNRLARELHDSVTQTLFSANLIAGVLPLLWEQDPEDGRARLAELHALTRGALAEMRALLLELRPVALAETPLPNLLGQLADAVSGRARMPVHLDVEEIDVPATVRVALYRVAQEALNNVVKHSGAGAVWMTLQALSGGDDRREGADLRVMDDGRGFDPAAVSGDHLGLRIMQERAEAVGAALRVTSAPDEGTLVRVVWRNAKEDGLISTSDEDKGATR